MKEDVLSMTIGVDIVYEVWTSLKEQLLPIPIEKKWFTQEYLRDFKNICDNLITIKSQF